MPEPELDFSGDFGDALSLIRDSLDNLYITGKAGTGKSTLLRELIRTTTKQTVVLAPTGVAAVNVGGQTIHSFFWFPTRLIRAEDVKVLPWKNREMLKALKLIVIDEVSMVRVDAMDAIDVSLRKNRAIDRPFGGVRMILIGDLHQLPPVIREKELREYFRTRYRSPYFFDADVFKDGHPKVVELKRIFRQADPAFIDLLNRIRHKKLLPEDFETLNAIISPSYDENIENEILLTSTNNLAREFNIKKLADIQSPSFFYQAEVYDEFDKKSFPTDERLELKDGARVMMIRNDQDGRWVNGTVGTISRCENSTVYVQIYGEEYQLKREQWEKIKYTYNKESKHIEPHVVGTFVQYPLKLAWAITIHKSQGKTCDKIAIDLGRGAFAHGQVYVAFSRSRTLGGIRLVSPVRESDIRVDWRVSKFEGTGSAQIKDRRSAPISPLLKKMFPDLLTNQT